MTCAPSSDKCVRIRTGRLLPWCLLLVGSCKSSWVRQKDTFPSFSWYHLNSSFHLNNLTAAFPSLELHFPHSRPEVNLSCFQPFIYKSVEQFSICFTLLTQVVLDFPDMTTLVTRLYRSLLEAKSLLTKKRICYPFSSYLLLLTVVHLYPLLLQ